MQPTAQAVGGNKCEDTSSEGAKETLRHRHQKDYARHAFSPDFLNL